MAHPPHRLTSAAPAITLPGLMPKQPSKPEMSAICRDCGARCCRYIATGIDTPTCKQDYDHIRWYLMHENMHVFVDHANDWYLEIESRCQHLGPDDRCLNYPDRPKICRRYGDDHQTCEYLSDDDPYQLRFSTAPEFEAWLDRRKIAWRFKNLKP